MDTLNIIGRQFNLFQKDLDQFDQKITDIIKQNRFLIIGGVGQLGRQL